MLMITEQQNATALTFKLAGVLAGEWARVLELCWRDAISERGVSRFIVDLTEVTFVDENGRALLGLMMKQGVELIVRDILMRSIVEEIVNESSIA